MKTINEIFLFQNYNIVFALIYLPEIGLKNVASTSYNRDENVSFELLFVIF